MADDPFTPLHEEISARARQLWQQAGQPAGRDEAFWLAAEAELRKDREITVTTAAKNPKGKRKAGKIAPPP
jgi:hypothetical protein